MGQKLKTDVPILKVHWPYTGTFREKEREYKKFQKQIRPTTQNKTSRSTTFRFSIRSGNDQPTPGNIVSSAGTLDYILWRRQMAN